MIKTRKAIALRLLMGAALTGAGMATTDAVSQPRYDRALAKATADRVAERLGGLRGGFAHNEDPVLLPDMTTTQSVSAERARTGAGFSRPFAVLSPAPRDVPEWRRSVRIVYAGSFLGFD